MPWLREEDVPEEASTGRPPGMSAAELETASRVLDDSLAWFAERGEPLNRHDDIQHQRKFNRWHSDGAVRAGRPIEKLLLFGFELKSVAMDLVSKFREKHLNGPAAFYVDRGMGDIFPIYSNSGRDIQGFVLSRVDDLAGCRIYPAVIPADQIGLCIASFGPAANRIRFLSELTSIYSHAVGITSQTVRFHGSLVTSFRNLVGFLRIELRPYRNDKSGGTGHTANHSEESCNIHSPHSTREEKPK